MKLIGFGYNKISIEKLSNSVENLKINTNIDISNIEQVKTGFFKSRENILEIKFKYNINYDEDIAKIELAGNIFLEIESKLAREVINQWKNKKIPEDFKFTLFNFIIKKSNIKALELEDEIVLPYHIPFPTLKKQDKLENNNSNN